MKYLYADIVIEPYSEYVPDVLAAMLGEVGFDTFEPTGNGMKAYIQKEMYSEGCIDTVIEDIPLPEVSIIYSVHELEEKDWNEEWERNNYVPILESEFGIVLNPRMAFGSGSHETTYQLTQILTSSDFTDKRVLDMGTGTGVLGIAMAKSGASEVVAIDIDEMSVNNAKENFLLNTFESNPVVTILHGDASAIEGTFDVIVANIHKNIIIRDLQIYDEHLASGGTLYLSGFFTDDVPDVVNALKANGLSVVTEMSKNDWAVIETSKKLT